MRQKRFILFGVVILYLLTGCTQQNPPVHINRFEQVLFDTPAEKLQQTLNSDSVYIKTPLLNCNPSDPAYLDAVGGFVSDPIVQYIYHKTDSLYHDLSWLEKELGDALYRAHKADTTICYNHLFTMVTGDFNYDTRVFCYDKDLVISIDCYAVPEMTEMQYFGMYSYLVNLCRKEYIAVDCMSAIAKDHITLPKGDLTFLDHAIYQGKALYFLDLTLPDTPDTLKIRYTQSQLQWMEENAKNVWGWLIQNNTLYCCDPHVINNFVGESPKTNAFKEGSAPRVSAWLGWQIVKKYMENTNCTLAQLFAETDSRAILTQSKWRP